MITLPFSWCIRWHVLETLCYHSLLLTHQLLLFQILPTDLYGMVGILFSMVYLIISLANIGFDATLPTFFTRSTGTQQSFKTILLPHLLVEPLLVCGAGVVALGGVFPLLPNTVPQSLTIILALFAVGECIKKHLRSFLHLSLLTQTLAFFEVGSLIVYLMVIWSSYAYYHTITLAHIFFPLMIITWMHVLILACLTYQIYCTLPAHDAPSHEYSHAPIIKNRLFNYGIHLHHQFFSTNFIVPLVALSEGLSQAAYMKLISSLFHSVLLCIKKVAGLTTDIMVSRAHQLGTAETHTLFRAITHSVYYGLGALLLIALLCWGMISMHQEMMHIASLVTLALFLITLFDHWNITYEKLYALYNKTWIIFFIMTLSHGLLLCCIAISPLSFSLCAILTLMVCLRIITSIIISCIAWYFWDIKPPFLAHAKKHE